jgi:hypothetical protein
MRAMLLAALLPVSAISNLAAADESKVEASPFLENAKKYVIESVNDRAKLLLLEKSLLNWTNPVRQQERGEVFVWLLEGRPLAIGSLFTYEYNAKVYEKHEFHSLSTKALRSTYSGKLAWNPKVPGIQWHNVQDSPEPARTHTARLLQMRQISRPFRAELVSPMDDRTELRLVSRPLFEYAAPQEGVVDGAIFSYTVATDPEVLLLVEAYDEKSADGSPRGGFRYAFARFHYWNVNVYDGDQKIWSAPLDKSQETNTIGDRANLEKPYISYRPTTD